MSGNSLFRTLSIKEIGFEKNVTALLYKSLNPSNQVNGPPESTQDLVFIIIWALDNGD
jgi:hypothetical protein